MNKAMKLMTACSAGLLFGAIAAFSETTTAEDYADDIVYDDGWTEGDNGGTNFAAWTFSEGADMFTIGTSTELGTGAPDIDTDGRSFRMLNTGESRYIYATRILSTPLAPSDRFTMNMTAFQEAGENMGFNIVNTSGDVLIIGRFLYGGTNTFGIYNGGPGLQFTDLTAPESFVITILQTSEESGQLHIESRSGESILSSYSGVMGGISLFAKPYSEATPADAMYFNSFKTDYLGDPRIDPPKEDFAYNDNDDDYMNGWDDGDNGGFGFAEWSFTGDAYHATIGDATGLHKDIPLNTNGKAFRIISTNGYAQILRNFSSTLPEETAFSIDVAAGLSQNNQGFQLRRIGADAATAGILTLSNRASDGGWTVTTASGKIDFIDSTKKEARSNTWFNVNVIQTTAEGGTYTITRHGEITGTMTGSYSGNIGALKFYSNVTEDIDAQAMFANNLVIKTLPLIYITGCQIAGSTATLMFESEYGRAYKIQGCKDLTSGTWTNVSELIEATDLESTNTVSTTDASFFRITESDLVFEDIDVKIK